jgi:hypothetical protein
MSALWEEQATRWARWAREPDFDIYWQVHRDAFLRLVPAAGRLTLDLGCGEGRPGAPFVVGGSYLGSWRYRDEVERDGLGMTFHSHHRSLEGYSRALEDAGMVVEAIREVTVDDGWVAVHPEAARWRRIPLFLHLRARADGETR